MIFFIAWMIKAVSINKSVILAFSLEKIKFAKN